MVFIDTAPQIHSVLAASSADKIQDTWFSPIMYFVYLFVILVIAVVWFQYSWSKKVSNFVRVLVVKPDGTTDTEYAPKEGGYVALRAPQSDTTRLWPISKLSAIEMLYPGDGFIPVFLQKKIKAVIVDEEDWEPLLNRGSYSERVASPDVVRVLRQLAEAYPDAAPDLTDLADSLSTAPTREMVASPAVLGNVMKEKVSEMAVSISKDTFDRMENIMKRLDKLPNGVIVYIGLGVVLLLSIITMAVVIAKTGGLGDIKNITNDLDAIKKSLGIK